MALEQKTRFELFRHSIARYKTYARILASEDPFAPFDPKDQVDDDLSQEGVVLAAESARKYFDSLRDAVEHERLVFVSSNEMRARETAAIYLEEARRRGFEIVAVPEVGRNPAPRDAEGKILIANAISLNARRGGGIIMAMFNSQIRAPINWEAVERIEPGFKEKWDRARAIIIADDHGSWGANFYHHGAAVKEIFPDLIPTLDELGSAVFARLGRLMKYAEAHARADASPEHTRILCFGHENYMGPALERYLGDHGIGNCESVSMILEEDGSVRLSRKDEQL